MLRRAGAVMLGFVHHVVNGPNRVSGKARTVARLRSGLERVESAA